MWQTDKIIEKARQLGIDCGDSPHQADRIRKIAEQVGMDKINTTSNSDIDKLEAILDERLRNENLNQNESVETLGENEFVDNQGQGRFGEAEYNRAKNKDGVYDKNYYANREKELDEKVEAAKQEKNKDWKMKDKNDKGPVKSDRSNTAHKSKWDKAKDNINLAKAKNERFQNKVSGAKAKAYNIMHPGEALKNKAKTAVKNTTKKAAKATAQVAKKAIVTFSKWLIKFIASHPYVLIIVVVLGLIFLLIIVSFYGTGDNDVTNLGYYDAECNYNDTTVNLTGCNSTTTQSMNLEEYVIGTTYSYVKDANYSDETQKALMIILKTNALSVGNYTNSRKSVSINDCDMGYTPTVNIPDKILTNLQSIYNLIEEEIFVSESYTSTISNLSSRSALEINSNVLSEIESLSSSYNYIEILNRIYNKELNNVPTENNYRETILVGDSRTLYMKNYGILTDNNSVYAGAMGYNWFNGNSESNFDTNTYNCKSNGINCVNQKIGNNPANIVIWLGVNDITNYQKYYEKYYELAKGEWANHYIYIVSVGYVDDEKRDSDSNIQIDTFNDYMFENISAIGLNNLIYIDLGYDSKTMANGTTDGIHYKKDFSQQIYNNILSQIGSSTNFSETKKIYKLNNYCTYYNVTENDAYWWPIGSSSETSTNIYGGSPMSTVISSPYGYRIHPVYGTNNMHSGIDIAAEAKSTIIATKSGTVTKVIDICTELVTGNGCNGGAGNMIVIDHEDGTSSRYLHMYPGSVEVKVGQQVKQGELIGLVGTTGTSTGNHLHFEIRLNGVQMNPLEYVDPENPRPISQYNLTSVNDNVTTPSETKSAICKSLLNSGFSKNAVAGMLVNIQAEGAFKLNNLENCYEVGQCCPNVKEDYGFCNKDWDVNIYANDESYTKAINDGLLNKSAFSNDHAGYGLIQWTSSDRKENLYDYWKKSGKTSIASLSVQLGYLLEELQQPSYSTTWKYVTGNYSAYEIAKYFCLDFERPSDEKSCPNRASSNIDSMVDFVENNCS